MLCLSASVDSCVPVYVSILTNTIGNSLLLEYEKCLLLESFPEVSLYEIQIQQQFLLHHYIFQFELLSFLYVTITLAPTAKSKGILYFKVYVAK